MSSIASRAPLFAAMLLWGSALPASAVDLDPAPAFPGDALTTLVIRVVDREGRDLDARLQVLDTAGRPLWPRGGGHHRWDAYSGHRFFYTSGPVTLGSRSGPVRVVASHGFEHATFDGWIPAAQESAVITLERLWDLRAMRWYGGDTHVHPAHGGEGAVHDITAADLARMTRAEDLAVVCALTNGPGFAGRTAVAAGPGHLIHYGMEYRSALFGHLDVLGLNSLLQPGCCLPGEAAYPLNLHIAEAAHAQGAVVIAAHPATMDPAQMTTDSAAWPYSGFNRELPVDVVLGGVDAIDVLSYSNASTEWSLKLWFDMLELGYRPALTAGTDASVNRWFDPPLGGYRVYARLAPGKPLNLDSWLEALRGGDTFVTNGPLPVAVSLSGKYPGQTVHLPNPQFTQLKGRITVHTKERLEYLDVYYNGQLRNRHILPVHRDVLDYKFTVSVTPYDAWVVFRVSGPSTDPSRVGTGQIAVTSPIFIKGLPREPAPEVRERYDAWIADLQDLVTARPAGSPSQLQSVLTVLQSARSTITGDPETALHSGVPLDGPGGTGAAAPAPRLRAEGPVLLADGAGEAAVQWFDVQGRLLRAGEPAPLPAAFPVPHLLPPGVYFARLVDPAGLTLAVTRLVKTD